MLDGVDSLLGRGAGAVNFILVDSIEEFYLGAERAIAAQDDSQRAFANSKGETSQWIQSQ